MDNKKRLGARLKQARENVGLTQDQAAEILGYSNRSTLSQIETGVNGVPLPKLHQMAELYGVPINDFLDIATPEPGPVNTIITHQTIGENDGQRLARYIAYFATMEPGLQEKVIDYIDLLRR